MKNLVYARFERMTVNEVSELMRIASGKMAIKIASVAPTCSEFQHMASLMEMQRTGASKVQIAGCSGRRGVRGNQKVVRDHHRLNSKNRR